MTVTGMDTGIVIIAGSYGGVKSSGKRNALEGPGRDCIRRTSF